MDLAGLPHGTVEGLDGAARAAGLEVSDATGFFTFLDPGLGFEIHAATLAAVRERAVGSGIAAERVDQVAAELQAAKNGQYEWVSSPFFLDLALRKPVAA